MWIDEKRIQCQDYDPREFDASDLCSPEEQARFERELDEQSRDEIAYFEAKEAEEAVMQFSESDYPF